MKKLTIIYAQSTIQAAAETLMNRFLGVVKAVVTPLAVVSLVACAITFFWSTDQKAVEKAKSWFIRVIIALVLIYTAQPLIKEIIRLCESLG